ncbi:MAG: Methylisocitrate lyase, partial [uncultured Acetobacteraceae bacterium]
ALRHSRRSAERARRVAVPAPPRPAADPANARGAPRHRRFARQAGRLRSALPVRRGHDGDDGAARPRHDHGGRSLLPHPASLARRRPAHARGRRHRLRRGAERHAHGALLRGSRRRRGPLGGPAPSQEVRAPERQEARGRARHGREGRRRAQGPATPPDHRPHRRGGERGHGRRGGAREAVLGGRRRRHLPRGAAQRGDVPRVRAADAGREAAGQHDRVRPHPLLHGLRVRRDGLRHGDLACVAPTGGRARHGGALRRHTPRRRHAEHGGPDADPGRALRNDRLRRLRGARRHAGQDRGADGDAAAEL